MISSFTVITPCFNAGSKLIETALSIRDQRAVLDGRVTLQHIVVDGGSSDGSIEALVERFGDTVEVISERDEGMYDALAKGFLRATGEVHYYLNAGDLAHPRAFDVVLDVMDDIGCEWVTGSHFYCNDRGQVISFKMPYRYDRKMIKSGLHGTSLPAVQQESTFWSGRLTRLIDLERLRTYRLAGDHFLWCTFADHADLHVVSSYLGGFTYHGGHLSGDMESYRAEMRRHTTRARPGTRARSMLDRLIWKLPDRVKLECNRSTLVTYDRSTGRWGVGRGRQKS